MKSVTEFPSFQLTNGSKSKTALAAEGKSAEEVLVALGEAFKLEGDRLKHFNNAIDVAASVKEGLKRVVVYSVAEGENPPPKSVKVEEFHYLPELHVHMIRVEKKPEGGRDGKRRGGGGGKGGPPRGKGGPGGPGGGPKKADSAKN